MNRPSWTGACTNHSKGDTPSGTVKVSDKENATLRSNATRSPRKTLVLNFILKLLRDTHKKKMHWGTRVLLAALAVGGSALEVTTGYTADRLAMAIARGSG